jgi:flagellar basal body-associated protein FliL
MPEPNDPDEEIRKKVVYEHVASSGTSRNMLIVIAVILVIALAIVGYIFMHISR